MSTKAEKATQEQQAPVVENNDCFIIMPIADHADYKAGHFKRVYEDILAPACRGAGYRPVRADDVAQTNLIHLDILQKLIESPMAICDLSTRNPNVLFELGLRQAFDKPTILVQEVGTPRIFDINMFRYTEYRNALDYRDVLADQKAIQKMLEETRDAVKDGKSVNSIIKLLSITAPAHLQDSSNFGDKEYFEILMSEIVGIKKELRSRPTVGRSSTVIYKSDYSEEVRNSNAATLLDKVEDQLRKVEFLLRNDPQNSFLEITELLENAESLAINLHNNGLPTPLNIKAEKLVEQIRYLRDIQLETRPAPSK